MGFWNTLGKFLFLRWLWRGLSGEESTHNGITDNPTNTLAHPYDRMSPINEIDYLDRDDYNYEYDMDSRWTQTARNIRLTHSSGLRLISVLSVNCP